ncbi:MAG: hypothetical protein ACKPH4_06955, partial [Microcystis panniformis]
MRPLPLAFLPLQTYLAISLTSWQVGKWGSGEVGKWGGHFVRVAGGDGEIFSKPLTNGETCFRLY